MDSLGFTFRTHCLTHDTLSECITNQKCEIIKPFYDVIKSKCAQYAVHTKVFIFAVEVKKILVEEVV